MVGIRTIGAGSARYVFENSGLAIVTTELSNRHCSENKSNLSCTSKLHLCNSENAALTSRRGAQRKDMVGHAAHKFPHQLTVTSQILIASARA